MAKKRSVSGQLARLCVLLLLALCLCTPGVACSFFRPSAEPSDIKPGNMNISTRKLAGDWDFEPDDGNYKLIIENNVLKLAPEEDEFGSALDTDYWEDTQNASLREKGGILTNTDGGAKPWALTARRKVAYGSADIVFEWSETDCAPKLYCARIAAFLWRNTDNWVCISYGTMETPKSENLRVRVHRMTGGNLTLLHCSENNSLYEKLRLRIRRDVSANNFSFYYSSRNAETGSWYEWECVWSGSIKEPKHFDTSHLLYPVAAWRRGGDDSETFTPGIERYYQYTLDIPAQRFWPDSPECNIIDSGAGRPEYCLNAGVNRFLKLTGFSAQVHEPRNSSVQFRAAFGDSPQRVSAIWINNGKWMSARELNRQVAAGVLDEHRYVFLKARFNSDGTAQPTLTSVSFSGTPGNTYGACAFDTHFATVDNNQKVDLNGAVAELQPEGDLFGSALDTVNWSETDHNELCGGSGYPKEGASLLESSGVLTNVSGTPSTNWSLGAKREVAYGDCDIVFEWEDTENEVASALSARVYNYLHLNATNYVVVYHRSRRFSGAYDELALYKRINGETTQLYCIYFSGLSAKVRFRFKRVAATNTFTFYTATWNGSSWNSWVQRWSGVIYDATYFNYAHQLFPISEILHLAADPTEFTPKLGAYFQKTDDGIAAQRFWNDSPEILVVNNTGVNWAFDAGKGKVWKLRDADCEKSEPENSSVKFKLGVSDTGKHFDATWLDKKWQTIRQINSNAAKGTYDGHRYIHVKAQFNSDGTDQPSLKSFLIHGSKVPR